jgi:hypothetical protein
MRWFGQRSAGGSAAAPLLESPAVVIQPVREPAHVLPNEHSARGNLPLARVDIFLRDLL